jgi:predicted Co/Zn/Cd cation transporter (cation efflux family)
MLQATAEQRLLRLSIGVTVVVSLFGVVFGLLSGSLSIVFDGVFAAIDAAMSGLALFVSRLVSGGSDNRRFQFGYWHIEPMVLAFNGGSLMLLCFYAFLNAVDSFLAGGRQLAFDWAIAYAVIVCATCFGMFFYERGLNRRIGSDFLRLDAQSWLMSGRHHLRAARDLRRRHGDAGNPLRAADALCRPVVLALLTICLVFVPIRTVRKACRKSC